MMDPSPHLENRRRPRPGCYPEQSPRTETKENGKCAICAKLPLRLRPLGQSLLFHSLECIDIDFGLFEIVNRRELEEDYELGADVANRTADNARRHAKCYRKLLSSAGLLREGQNFSGQATCARVVAVSPSRNAFAVCLLLPLRL